MSDAPPPVPLVAVSRPGAGRIFGSLSFMLGWAVVHYVLFLLFAGGGIVIEVLLSIAKTVLFPGRSLHEQHIDISAWSAPLTTGLVIAGLAGVAAGLAILWKHKRKVMIRTFWITFLIGIALELYALLSFIVSAFSVEV